MEEIKNCPLCGSHANLESFERNGIYFYMVRCSNKKCHLRSIEIKIGENERFEGKSNIDVTPVMAINHVVKAWNMRTENSCRENTKSIIIAHFRQNGSLFNSKK